MACTGIGSLAMEMAVVLGEVLILLMVAWAG